MWTVSWWKDVAERTVRTFAATLAGLLIVNGTPVGLPDFLASWPDLLWTSGITALVTFLMALGTHAVTGNGPSFTSVYKDELKKQTGEEEKNDSTDAAA